MSEGVWLFWQLKLGLSLCRRYGSKTAALRHIFSEYGLIKFRVLVECRWLQQLSDIPEIKEVPAFSKEAKADLAQLASTFGVADAVDVKKVGSDFGMHACIDSIHSKCMHARQAQQVCTGAINCPQPLRSSASLNQLY